MPAQIQMPQLTPEQAIALVVEHIWIIALAYAVLVSKIAPGCPSDTAELERMFNVTLSRYAKV